MNKSKMLLTALKAVKAESKKNRESILGGTPARFVRPWDGICYAVERALISLDYPLTKLDDELLHPYFKTWEHFSGDVYFPVGTGQGDYIFKSNLWIGDIGELRLNLLDHLISEVEKETQKATH